MCRRQQKRKVRFQMSIDANLKEKLEKLQQDSKVSVTEIIRRALKKNFDLAIF